MNPPSDPRLDPSFWRFLYTPDARLNGYFHDAGHDQNDPSRFDGQGVTYAPPTDLDRRVDILMGMGQRDAAVQALHDSGLFGGSAHGQSAGSTYGSPFADMATALGHQPEGASMPGSASALGQQMNDWVGHQPEGGSMPDSGGGLSSVFEALGSMLDAQNGATDRTNDNEHGQEGF